MMLFNRARLRLFLIHLSVLLPTKAALPSPSRLYLSHPAPLHIGHIGVGQREKCVKSQSGCWSKFWHSEGQRGKWRKGKVNCKVGEGKSILLTPTFKHIVAPHSSTSSPAYCSRSYPCKAHCSTVKHILVHLIRALYFSKGQVKWVHGKVKGGGGGSRL